MNTVELSLVIPVKDEEAAIGPCLERVIPVLEAMNDPAARSFEILFVDDGSTDRTLEVIRKAHASDAQLDRDLAALYQKMYDTELHFLSRTEMHSDDKWYVEKYKVYFNLIWLLAEVGGGGGDVMGGAGYRPTNAASGVYEEQLKGVQMGRSALTTLMQEVEAFNKAHAGRLPPISDRLGR